MNKNIILKIDYVKFFDNIISNRFSAHIHSNEAWGKKATILIPIDFLKD